MTSRPGFRSYLDQKARKRARASSLAALLLGSANAALAHGSPVGPVPGHSLHTWTPAQPQFHSSLASLLPQVNHAFAHTAIAPTQGLDLNLASSAAVVALMPNLFGRAPSVTLDVGGTARTFRSGEHVTAAEYVAIKQVLAGNTQTIVLDGSGVATGGSFALNSIPRKTLELVIPAGVTGIDDFAAGKTITINGDIVNYGSLYGLSTNGQITAGAIFAKDIVNGSGGLISTQLPGALVNSIVGALPLTDLTLGASGGITNAGTISGSRNLTLDSGGPIANFGSVASAHGNINLSSRANADLNIVATGGTFQAAQGDINIRDAQYAGSKNVTLDGGNYLSNNLNIWSGGGAITGSIDNVTGVINTNAVAAHLFANTQVMYLGNNCSLGDPTYVNSGGSIVINGAVTAGEAITILAAKDITVQAGSDASISTRRASGAGSDITLVAGANVSTTGADVAGAIPGASAIAAGKTASVDFTSGAGGKIDLSGGTHVGAIIDSGSNDSNAGNVTLAAYANGATGGTIVVPAGGGGGASILASAPGGSGGNVTIVAGANPASAAPTVTIGGAIQTSGVVKSGNISITTANPDSSDNTHVVTWDSSGNVTSGNSVVAGTAFAANGQVATGDLISAGGGGAGSNGNFAGSAGGSGGNIIIQSGAGISTGNLLAYGGGGGGDETTFAKGGGDGGAGGTISLTGNGGAQTGAVTVTGSINSSGGGGGGSYSNTTSKGGGAGAITIEGAGAVSVSGAVYAGIGGDGGAANYSVMPPPQLPVPPGGYGGGGGGSYGGGGGGSAGPNFPGVGGGGISLGGSGAINTTGASGGGIFGPGTPTNTGLAFIGYAGFVNSNGAFSAGKNVTDAALLSIKGDGVQLGDTFYARDIKIQTNSGNNGDISLSGLAGYAVGSINLVAHGSGSILSQGGYINAPSVVLSAESGNIGTTSENIYVNTASLQASATGAASDVYIHAQNGTNITGVSGAGNTSGTFSLIVDGKLQTSAAISAHNVILKANDYFYLNSGTIFIGAPVTGTTAGTVTLTADSTIDNAATGALITADTLTVTSKTTIGGATALQTAVNHLAANTSESVYINNVGSVDLLASSSGDSKQFTVTTTPDAGGNGRITISGDIKGYANLVTLASSESGKGLGGVQEGPVTQGVIYARELSLSDGGVGTGSFGSSATPLQISAFKLDIGTTGDAYLVNTPTQGQGLNLGTVQGHDVSIVSGLSITTQADITATGKLTLETVTLNNSKQISAGSIEIRGAAGSDLLLTNTGKVTATAGDIQIDSAMDFAIYIDPNGAAATGSFNVSGSHNIVLNANASGPSIGNGIYFYASQDFNTDPAGAVYFNAGSNLNQSIQVNQNCIVTGNNTVYATTNQLYLAGQLIGNPLVLSSPTNGAGSIINSSGDVQLTTDLIFHGQSLSIFASGNIIASGSLTIDLSNSSAAVNGGTGGSLTLVSGFDITPSTDTKGAAVPGTFVIGAPASSGGNIEMGKVSIFTGSSVDGAAAGTLVVAAHDGATNAGSIALGAIDTSSSGAGATTGGKISILGPGGITVGDINTAAATSGLVNIQGAVPYASTFLVFSHNGALSSGTFSVSNSPVYSGDIVVGGINSPGAPVFLQTGGTSSITGTTPSTPITAAYLGLNAGSGGLGSQANPLYTQIGNQLTASAGVGGNVGNAYINNLASGQFNILNFFANNASIFSVGPIANISSCTTNGALSINTNKFINSSSVYAASVQITGLPGQALTIDNPGFIYATAGNVQIDSATDQNVSIVNSKGTTNSPGFMSVTGAGQIIVNANASKTANQIILSGYENFYTDASGSVSLNANFIPGQAITVQSGAKIVGNNTVYVNSSKLNLQGILTGNPLVMSVTGTSGTIANSSGDVALNSDFIFVGQNLAILASGNITMTGNHLINLAGEPGAVNGGSLNVVAGFNFTPSTNGAEGPTSNGYTLSGATSASGGNVFFGTATIFTSTSVSGANGGSVTVVAHGGGINQGTITLGNITTDSAGVGSHAGDVLVIGQGGVTVGNIDTTAASAGNVSIFASAPRIIGGSIVDNNGALSGGSFAPSATFAGNISLSGIAAGGANILIQTGGAGNITGTSALNVLAGNAVTLMADSGNIGSGANPIYVQVPNISIIGASASQGNAFVSNLSSAPLTINNLGGHNISLSTQGALTTGGDFAVGGNLSLTAVSFTNSSKVTAGSIQITGVSGQDLTVSNAGTVTATSGNIDIDSAIDHDVFFGNGGGANPVGKFAVSGSAFININANISNAAATNKIVFNGDQNFDTDVYGATVLNAGAAGQSVNVDKITIVTGNNTVVVNSNSLNAQGVLSGNPLIFNSKGVGTIANSGGDVNLSSDLIFHGQSLAILASGNVTMSGSHVIDLAGQNGTLNGGAGGNLTVVAGFDFTPTTGGQVGPVATTFILDGTTSASGGSINFGKTTITTGSAVSGSSGGNVSMYAHAGANDTGGISVGSIDTSAAGNSSKGGAVVLIGQGGVSAGDITTTGFASGSVSLLAAAPQITGGNVQVSQGVVSGPGVFGPGSAYGGNITIGGINSGGASVLIQTGGAGSIVGTTAGAAINAASLVLVSGSGGIGTAANSLYSNASTLSADTGTSVNGTGVWLVDSAAQVNLVGTNRATSFSLSAPNGNISVVGSVVANNLNVAANGNILLPSANLAVVADGTTGNGGSISLAAKSIDWVGSSVSDLVLNANAASSGTTQNGGSINVILSAAGDQALGNQKGQFQLTASSGATKGNGGSLNFTNAAADLTVDVANGIAAGPQGTQGDGASIVLTAQNVLSANPGSPFVINVSGAGSGNGGTAAITILGNHDAVIGTGNNQFQLVANSGATGGNGGKVALSTQGALTIDSAALAFNPLGANGNSGTIQLTAAKLTPSSFVINASGVGTGNGGAIAIQLDGAGAASIGLGSGQYRLIASSGAKGGDGGSVSFVNGGNLTVDPKGITVGPLGAKGNGGNITLEAGHGNTLLAGNLLVTGALSANAKGKAVGGNITLTSNGTDTATNQVFVLGDTSKSIVNGVLGNITVSGAGGNGSLSVTNMNGGIIQRSVITAVKNVTYTDRGNFGFIEIDKPLGSATTAQITLNALGNNASNTLSGGSLTANTIVINSPSGQFGNVKPLAIKTSDLTVTGAATVIVKNSGSTPLTIGASAASNLNISSNGAIVLGGDVSAASVWLKSGAGQGISALLPSYQISAQFMTLTSGTKGIGSATQALLVNTQVLTINSGSGSAYVSNNNSSILTLAGSNTAGTLKLSTLGSIYVSAIVGKSNSNVDLVSQFGSFLSAGTVNDVITGKNVVLAAGNNIGSPGSLNDVPLMIKATNLTANAGGLVILSNLSTSPVTLNDSAGSYFVYTGKAATTIHNVATSDGKIAISTTSGLLQTAVGSSITANNGTISLQESNQTSGSILIGKNSTIATSGSGGGDVFITIGNLQIPSVQGTAPANVVTLHPGSGSDYYGKNGITALAPVNTITLKGASVYFNTDTRPASAIKLGGGVNITADPPGPADGIVATDASHALVQAPLLVSAAPGPIKATLAPAVSTTATPVTLKGEIEQTAPAQISAPLNLQPLAQNMSLPAMASLAASVSARQQGQLGWISDTELASGEIPAMISGACAPLERGSVVFAPTKDIVVQTAYGPLDIAAKSVVLVMSFRHGLAIYNLHDLRANAVCIKVSDSNKKIALIPGRAAVITGTNVRAFEQINPAQLFAYRNLRCRNVGESKQVFLSEFHTLQAISCVQPLKEMLRSKDAGAQKISGRLLKTSAILLQMGGARFEQIPRPHAIASN